MKSSLDYAIELLETERQNLLNWQQLTGENQRQRVNRIEGISRAILILNAEKIRDESGIIPEKKAKKILSEKI